MEQHIDTTSHPRSTFSGPLVSVIIIFLNAEHFIEEAIQSVLEQTYANWELLLVDDGSADGSTRIAKQYATQDKGRICYLEHERHQNMGMSTSRNLGVRHARGEYIAFLDADDVWFPHKLQRQVAILKVYADAGWVYGLSQWWYSWMQDPADSRQNFVHELGVTPNTLIEPPRLLAPFFFHRQATIPGPSNIMLRRSLLERVGGFEDAFRADYEDQVLYAKLCLHSAAFASNECWDRYRQHSESASALEQRMGRRYSARLSFLYWLEDYFQEQGVTERSTQRLLRGEIWRCRYPRLSRLREVSPKRRLAAGARRLQRAVRSVLPSSIPRWLARHRRTTAGTPAIGSVTFGDLQRPSPISREFGFDRGLPVDRHFIEQFLAKHADDIRGHVLEVEDCIYTHRFGGKRVSKSDVLHVQAGHPHATIIADLTHAPGLPCESFDCVILTQTLQFIYDVRAAISTVERILKPGGVVLATIPGISPIIRYDMERWGQYWSFTTLSARRLFQEVFLPAQVSVESYGNVLAAASFLYGLATEELQPNELAVHDPDFEVLIAIRAVKSFHSE